MTAPTGGEWRVHHGIRRWHPGPPPPPPEPLIACPTCQAPINKPCTSRTGHRSAPHIARITKTRLCPCGNQLDNIRRRFCEPCRLEARRATWRKYGRKRNRKASA